MHIYDIYDIYIITKTCQHINTVNVFGNWCNWAHPCRLPVTDIQRVQKKLKLPIEQRT